MQTSASGRGLMGQTRSIHRFVGRTMTWCDRLPRCGVSARGQLERLERFGVMVVREIEKVRRLAVDWSTMRV
jgi:hypothetical protein